MSGEVLIVDDDEAIRETLAYALELWGASINQASSWAAQAIARRTRTSLAHSQG